MKSKSDSISLFLEFLTETPVDKLNAMVSTIDNMKFHGIKIEQYLDTLPSQLGIDSFFNNAISSFETVIDPLDLINFSKNINFPSDCEFNSIIQNIDFEQYINSFNFDSNAPISQKVTSVEYSPAGDVSYRIAA